MIAKLLKGQTKLVRTIELDSRLNACFLGEVSLQGSSKTIGDELLDSIRQLSDCLRYCNAQAFIRGLYFDYNSPVSSSCWLSCNFANDNFWILLVVLTSTESNHHSISVETLVRGGGQQQGCDRPRGHPQGLCGRRRGGEEPDHLRGVRGGATAGTGGQGLARHTQRLVSCMRCIISNTVI